MKIAGLILAALFLGLCLPGEEKIMAIEPGANNPVGGPGLKVGTVAPDFTGVTYMGNKIRLSDVYKNGPVVLIFYRGAWCPYCNLHLQSFQKRLKDFEKLGATILAVSIDKPEYGAETVKDNSLGFEVISDTQANILEAYKVIYKVPDQLAEKYRNEYQIDLEAHSGRTDHLIAIPATYIIDKTGKIVFAYANEDYKVRTQPNEVLDVLEKLK
ncbi:MAG: redoxin domain-containing protein [Omnitrophica bacterium]|nr:redoxin domain-containing protein [Candidatus Omnitrophota bacterium]